MLKGFKHHLRLGCRDADSRIHHADDQTPVVIGLTGTLTGDRLAGNGHFQADGSLGGELESIGEEILDNLFDAFAVA